MMKLKWILPVLSILLSVCTNNLTASAITMSKSHGSREARQGGYLIAEFTYPILPKHEGGSQWFYSLPKHDNLCRPAEKPYADYLGDRKFGNIFSVNVGPNYEGRLRDIDVKTLKKVGKMIESNLRLPQEEKK